MKLGALQACHDTWCAEEDEDSALGFRDRRRRRKAMEEGAESEAESEVRNGGLTNLSFFCGGCYG